MSEKKGFFGKIFDKLDKKMEQKAKQKKCCCCDSSEEKCSKK
jgi:hypothetical protein